MNKLTMKDLKPGDNVKVKVWVDGTSDEHVEIFAAKFIGYRSVDGACLVDVANSRLIQISSANKDKWWVSPNECVPMHSWGYIVEKIDRYAKIEDGMTGGPSGLKWL